MKSKSLNRKSVASCSLKAGAKVLGFALQTKLILPFFLL